MSKRFKSDERQKVLDTIKSSTLWIKDADKAYGISVATYYNRQNKHRDNTTFEA